MWGIVESHRQQWKNAAGLPVTGKQHTSGHGKAALVRLLDELGERAPALVRGDCGYGKQDIIDVCE
jgi:hypothetical protein